MKLEVNKIKPSCEGCKHDPYGPYWSKGIWFYRMHKIEKCPTCKVKLPLVNGSLTLYSKLVEEISRFGIHISFCGFFLEKLDRRSKKYKTLIKGK